MSRKSSSPLEQLLHECSELLSLAPWWVIGAFVVLAIAIYHFHNVWISLSSILLTAICLAAAYNKITRAIVFDRVRDIESIRNLTWRDFETLIGESYRRQGYSVEVLGGDGPDGGVDLRMRRSGETTLVQCKHWKGDIGVTIIRELAGVMVREKARRAICVTSGNYTQAALSEAKQLSIELISGHALVELLRDVRRTNAPDLPASTLPIKEAVPTELSHASAPAATLIATESIAPACPRCGAAMALRVAKRGDRAGSSFWGCSQYPRCRGTVNVFDTGA